MLKEATERIISLLESAEQRRIRLKESIKNLQRKRDSDKAQLLRDELMFIKMGRETSQMLKIRHLQKVIREAKEVMDEDTQLAQMRRKHADVDHKKGEIKHWTEQSEYEDDKSRREALIYANRTFNAL